MKVFVTGATGFVGQEIVRQLHEAGYSIRVLAGHRPSQRSHDNFGEVNADRRIGDVINPKMLKGQLEGCHAVIHLVGIISEIDINTFENVHVRGTRNVVAAAREQGVNRFVHMSALGTRQNAVSRYHRTKWEAEEIVRGSGLEFTIFRPSLIFGPRDMFVNLFAKMIRLSPVVPVLGRRDASFQPVAIETVASAFVKSLTETAAIHGTFDLAGPETLTMSEIIDQISAVMKRKRLKVNVPAAVARIQAGFLEFLYPRILRKAAPLNRDQLTMLEEDNVGDPEPANKMFGLKAVRFRDGIGKYL